MSFQVYVNNIAINDEPMGLTEATVKIMRDEQFSGIVSNIVSDLSFWGDGYDIIYGLFQSTTGCLDIPIRIEQTDCLGFIFEGIIFLADIELDISRCIAKCTLSDNSLSSLIGRNYDVKVPINAQKSLDGTALTAIGEDIYNPFYVDDGSTNPPDPKPWPWPPNGKNFVDGPFKWYGIMELYPYIIKYFTNNAPLTFQDLAPYNYFTDPTLYFTPHHFELQVTGAVTYVPGGPFTCDFVYLDAFGAQRTITINLESAALPGTTNIDAINANIQEQIGSHFNLTSFNPYDGEWIENYCDRAMYVTRGVNVGTLLNPDYITDVFFPFNAGSPVFANFVNCTIVTAQLTEIQPYTYGPYYAKVTSGKTLKNFANPDLDPNTSDPDSLARGAKMNISFADLQMGFGNLFGIGIRFYRDANGNDIVTIGQEKNFYETTEAFSIDAPYQAIMVKDGKFGLSSLKIGQTNTNPSFEFGTQEKADYVSNVCSPQNYEANIGFEICTVDNLVKIPDVPSLNDETIYIAEKDPVQYNNAIVGNYYKIAAHGVSYRRRDDWQGLGIYAPKGFYGEALAGIVNHPEIARAYVHRAGDGFSWNGNFIPNNSGPKIRNRVTFEAPITVEQFNLIQANPYQKIRFGTGLYETGWVMSLEYNITSGMTKFELLTE